MSIEPSTYDRARHPEYGSDAESKLLAGIMGHNLCIDMFGGPSEEEAAAGMTVVACAISRLETGAHWPTDVLAAVLIATAWLAFVVSVRWISDGVLGSDSR